MSMPDPLELLLEKAAQADFGLAVKTPDVRALTAKLETLIAASPETSPIRFLSIRVSPEKPHQELWIYRRDKAETIYAQSI